MLISVPAPPKPWGWGRGLWTASCGGEGGRGGGRRFPAARPRLEPPSGAGRSGWVTSHFLGRSASVFLPLFTFSRFLWGFCESPAASTMLGAATPIPAVHWGEQHPEGQRGGQRRGGPVRPRRRAVPGALSASPSGTTGATARGPCGGPCRAASPRAALISSTPARTAPARHARHARHARGGAGLSSHLGRCRQLRL